MQRLRHTKNTVQNKLKATCSNPRNECKAQFRIWGKGLSYVVLNIGNTKSIQFSASNFFLQPDERTHCQHKGTWALIESESILALLCVMTSINSKAMQRNASPSLCHIVNWAYIHGCRHQGGFGGKSSPPPLWNRVYTYAITVSMQRLWNNSLIINV